MKLKVNNRGFSLIEVMVALLVLALGILGISKLQGTLIRNSSDANQRAVATSIAQEKIDDLRSFANVGSGVAWTEGTDASNLSANELAYAHIDDNAGGAPLGTVDLLANQTITRGNAQYTLNWDVEDYVFNSAMTAASLAGPTVTGDMKLVNVNVAWSDESGDQQSVTLSTIIDARNPALIALSGASKEGGDPPVAEYTPEEAPDVINVEVDTGNNKFRQTSKPLPDAVTQGQNANTLVSFEVVTYSTYNGPVEDLEFVADRIEEYVTVDCKCQFSSVNATARTAAHVRWDPETDSRYDYPGELVSKQTAVQVDNVNAVDELCTTCCRDHHDPDASVPKYVPGTTGGNHVHYNEDGDEVSDVGEVYVESCRMKKIDGIFRVFQDWNLYELTVMNREELADGEQLQTDYSSFVEQYVIDTIVGTDSAVKPGLRSPLELNVATGKQLQSRGIYIDNVYDDLGSIASGFTTYLNDDTKTDRLDKVPFAEVNLTLLSLWESGDSSKVSVTNEDVASVSDPINDYYGSYSRGYIETLAAAASPGIDISSDIDPTNDGITQLRENYPALPDRVHKSDTIAVIVEGTATNITITGTINLTGPGGTKLSLTSNGNCSDPNNQGAFTCSYPSGSSVSITATAVKTGGNACTGADSFNQIVSSDTTVILNVVCN